MLHILSMIVLIRSALPTLVIIPFLLILIILMVKLGRSKDPLPLYFKLSYHQEHWLLHEVNGQKIKYKKASIGFDGGLYILLRLTAGTSTKTLIIFKDQMTTAQYRVLKFILFSQQHIDLQAAK